MDFLWTPYGTTPSQHRSNAVPIGCIQHTRKRVGIAGFRRRLLRSTLRRARVRLPVQASQSRRERGCKWEGQPRSMGLAQILHLIQTLGSGLGESDGTCYHPNHGTSTSPSNNRARRSGGPKPPCEQRGVRAVDAGCRHCTFRRHGLHPDDRGDRRDLGRPDAPN